MVSIILFGDRLKEIVNLYYLFSFSNKQEKPMQHFISYCFIENDQFHCSRRARLGIKQKDP